jgi:5'-nucleotidase
VIVAFEGLIKSEPKMDLVISGINAGPNRGDDVLYSGTVAAAIEAMCFGVKAIALSITSHTDQKYETAVGCFLYLLEKGITDYIGHREILNINVPNIDLLDINGYEVCATGFRRYQDMLTIQFDPRGREVYWIMGRDPVYEESQHELDYYVTLENKVSISPLKIDLNDYQKIKAMRSWVERINEI